MQSKVCWKLVNIIVILELTRICLSPSLKDTIVSYMERKDLDIPPEVDEFFPEEILLSQYTNTWEFSVLLRQERNQRWSAVLVLLYRSCQEKLSCYLQVPNSFSEQTLKNGASQRATVFCCILRFLASNITTYYKWQKWLKTIMNLFSYFGIHVKWTHVKYTLHIMSPGQTSSSCFALSFLFCVKTNFVSMYQHICWNVSSFFYD